LGKGNWILIRGGKVWEERGFGEINGEINVSGTGKN